MGIPTVAVPELGRDLQLCLLSGFTPQKPQFWGFGRELCHSEGEKGRWGCAMGRRAPFGVALQVQGGVGGKLTLSTRVGVEWCDSTVGVPGADRWNGKRCGKCPQQGKEREGEISER